MAFKVVFTEFIRDLQNSATTFIFSLLLGFILFFVGGVSNYLNTVFEAPKWNVDMLILPKGITPELAAANLTKGAPDGLIPLALFNTLLQQSHGSTIKLLGIVPYKNSDGNPEIAVTDSELKDFADLNKNSLWKEFKLTELNLKRADFKPVEVYQTPEWRDQVLMGIIVNGSTSEISGLKTLIDRKTIAQAYFVGPENADSHVKLVKLKRGLFLTVGFVLLSTLLGLLLALKNMKAKRNSIELVLNELKFKSTMLTQIKALQFFVFIVFPIALGFLFSILSFNTIQSYIFNI